MKRLIFTLVFVVTAVLLQSCRDTEKDSGWNKTDLEDYTPMRIVWSMPGKSGPTEHKVWHNNNQADVDELNIIWKHLLSAERAVLPLNATHQLSVVAKHNKTGDEIVLKELFDPHKLSLGNFVGQYLFSPKLGELLRKYLPEETKPYVPYDRKRVEKMQQQLMEQVEKLRQQENGVWR
jgi:hypothetical protein